MAELSSNLEDYLEVICNNTNSGKTIRAVDVSRELKISRASVTEALKKLSDKGYVNYSSYGSITLTDLGFDTAQKVISKHNILQRFFEKLGLSSKEASENACKIEHVITDNAFNKIAEFIK